MQEGGGCAPPDCFNVTLQLSQHLHRSVCNFGSELKGDVATVDRNCNFCADITLC